MVIYLAISALGIDRSQIVFPVPNQISHRAGRAKGAQEEHTEQDQEFMIRHFHLTIIS